ncbi:MAG: rhodanese-like domain-containing protein [Actinomycetota bacterium]
MPGTVNASELQRMLDDEGAQVVEVLPKEEYEDEHIAGAIHIHLKKLNPESCEQLDLNRAVIVYCHDYL